MSDGAGDPSQVPGAARSSTQPGGEQRLQAPGQAPASASGGAETTTAGLGTVDEAYRLSAEAVLAALDVEAAHGLSTPECDARRQQYGPNLLPAAPPVPVWRRLLRQFQDPLTMLLLAATVVSFVAWLGERDTSLPFDTIVILAIVLLNGVLGFVQENRAEHAVAALQAMSAPSARVLRDGQVQEVPAADLVPGDILVLEEGDTIPADARVLDVVVLRIAEAALTGESVPVSKSSAPIDAEAGLADQENMLFSGTAVTSGRGR